MSSVSRKVCFHLFSHLFQDSKSSDLTLPTKFDASAEKINFFLLADYEISPGLSKQIRSFQSYSNFLFFRAEIQDS